MKTSPAVLRHAQIRLIQTNAATLVLYAGYCQLHGVVIGERADGAVAFAAALAEWGPWLVLAPVVAAIVFRLVESHRPPSRLVLAAVAWCLPLVSLALAARFAFEWLSGEPDLVHVLFYHAPTHLGALVVTVAGSAWFCWSAKVTASLPAEPRPVNPRLKVTTARGSHVLCAEEIETLAAGGNYVDVVTCTGARYLVRATMKDLEARFAGSAIIRTHRSHFANARRAVRLEHRPSGNHVLVLAGGMSVPVSKGHRDGVRAAIHRFRGETAAAS